MNCLIKTCRGNYWLLLPLILLLVTTGCATTKPGEAEAESAASESVIHEITVSEEQTAVFVTVKGSQPLSYSAIKHLFPLGVVLYFPGTSLEGIQETYAPESRMINSIVASQRTEEEGSSRIQINLNDDVQYEVSQEGNDLLVQFTKPTAEEPAAGVSATAALAETSKPEAALAETGDPASTEPEEEPAAVAAEDLATGGEPALVKRVDFLMMEQGKSRVIVQTTRKVMYETLRPSPKRVLLKLFNAKIPRFEKRPLITTRFKSAVDRVVPVQTAQMGDIALIAIELREEVPYRVEQQDTGFFVDFEPSTVAPRPMADAAMPKWQQVMRETEAVLTEAAAAPSEEVVSGETGKVYTGQKISLDFQDADIRNVFRILHEISGKNFIIGSDVKGKVTLKLDQVPWDQVLDLVTRMNKLGVSVEGNIVRIAPHAVIEAEKAAERKTKQAEQEAAPLVTEYIPINYATASAVQAHLNEVKTDRGRVTVDERTNMIIMTDVQDAIQRAGEVIKKLDVVTRQVIIEARIVEARADFSREFGIQWGFNHVASPDSGSAQALGGPYGFSGGLANNMAVNLPAVSATGAIDFMFARLGGGSTQLSIDASLQAMESRGVGKIISSPKVLTLDNKAAIIKQGTQIPYQTSDEGTVAVTFQDAVLSLEVTPHITMDNRISMLVNITKDAPDTGISVLGQPAISKKEVTTELLVNNGDTVVIGGIIAEDEGTSEGSIPGLGKIPVLGWLFKNQSKRDSRTELLVFITPTIVELGEVSLK
jgi:type IV pilus assembly protein PilQ